MPYGASLLVVVGLLPVEERLDLAEVSAALTLLVAAGAGLTAAALGHERRGTTLASLLSLLAAIMLLRDGVGASAGFGPLIFLPVMWAALERRRTELVLVLVGVAAIYFVPMLVVGGPQYPSSGWRGGTLMLVVASSAGFAVLALVEHLRAEGERSATILGAMSEGFALTRDGEIVQVNPALCAITGFSEARADRRAGAVPVLARRSRWRRTASCWPTWSRRAAASFDIELARADGTRFPAVISCVPTDLGDGSRSFLNTVRDVTELRAHEAAQRRHAEQLANIADVIREIGHCDPLDARPDDLPDRAGADRRRARGRVWEDGHDGGMATTATLPETTAPYRIGPSQTTTARAW